MIKDKSSKSSKTRLHASRKKGWQRQITGQDLTDSRKDLVMGFWKFDSLYKKKARELQSPKSPVL